MNPIEYFIQGFRKYATFSGRARRSEYWYFVLFYFISIFLSILLYDVLFGGNSNNSESDIATVFILIFTIVIIIPLLAVTVRRLHDTNHSGWWILIRFIPLVGQFILIIFLATDGTPGRNDYGENPKNPYSEEDDIMDHLID